MQQHIASARTTRDSAAREHGTGRHAARHDTAPTLRDGLASGLATAVLNRMKSLLRSEPSTVQPAGQHQAASAEQQNGAGRQVSAVRNRAKSTQRCTLHSPDNDGTTRSEEVTSEKDHSTAWRSEREGAVRQRGRAAEGDMQLTVRVLSEQGRSHRLQRPRQRKRVEQPRIIEDLQAENRGRVWAKWHEAS